MIELDLYPNENNLLNFIELNYSKWKNRKNVPKNNILKYYFSMDKSISDFVNNINNFLKSKNIDYSMNPIIFILLHIVLFIIFLTIMIKKILIIKLKMIIQIVVIKEYIIIRKKENQRRNEYLIENLF